MFRIKRILFPDTIDDISHPNKEKANHKQHPSKKHNRTSIGDSLANLINLAEDASTNHKVKANDNNTLPIHISTAQAVPECNQKQSDGTCSSMNSKKRKRRGKRERRHAFDGISSFINIPVQVEDANAQNRTTRVYVDDDGTNERNYTINQSKANIENNKMNDSMQQKKRNSRRVTLESMDVLGNLKSLPLRDISNNQNQPKSVKSRKNKRSMNKKNNNKDVKKISLEIKEQMKKNSITDNDQQSQQSRSHITPEQNNCLHSSDHEDRLDLIIWHGVQSTLSKKRKMRHMKESTSEKNAKSMDGGSKETKKIRSKDELVSKIIIFSCDQKEVSLGQITPMTSENLNRKHNHDDQKNEEGESNGNIKDRYEDICTKKKISSCDNVCSFEKERKENDSKIATVKLGQEGRKDIIDTVSKAMQNPDTNNPTVKVIVDSCSETVTRANLDLDDPTKEKFCNHDQTPSTKEVEQNHEKKEDIIRLKVSKPLSDKVVTLRRSIRQRCQANHYSKQSRTSDDKSTSKEENVNPARDDEKSLLTLRRSTRQRRQVDGNDKQKATKNGKEFRKQDGAKSSQIGSTSNNGNFTTLRRSARQRRQVDRFIDSTDSKTSVSRIGSASKKSSITMSKQTASNFKKVERTKKLNINDAGCKAPLGKDKKPTEVTDSTMRRSKRIRKPVERLSPQCESAEKCSSNPSKRRRIDSACKKATTNKNKSSRRKHTKSVAKSNAQLQHKAIVSVGSQKKFKLENRLNHSQEQVKRIDVPESNDWDAKSIHLLLEAHKEVDPKSFSFWHQVAGRIPKMTAEQCRDKFFALVKTPKLQRKKGKRGTELKSDNVDESDDIFNSTPIRDAGNLVGSIWKSSAKDENGKMISNKLAKSMQSSTYSYYHNTDQGKWHSSPLQFRPNHKGYIKKVSAGLNQKKFGNKMQNVVKKAEKKKPSYISAAIDAGDVHMDGVLCMDGTLIVDAPDEDDAENLYIPIDDS